MNAPYPEKSGGSPFGFHIYPALLRGAMHRTCSKQHSFGLQRPRSMKSILASIAFFLATMAQGQNLVPNGSFEEYDHCPNYWNQLEANVVGWDVCSPSPDFFNTCRDSSDFGVPYNWRGYQQAAQGYGYIGIGTYQWNAPNFREFACAELLDPLSPGVPVDLLMKVAAGGFGSYSLFSPKWTTRGIGMLLTTQPFNWSPGLFPNTAQLYMDAVIMDTMNWVVLNRTYLPDSAYRYITLGNFFEDSLSSPTMLDTAFGNLEGAYCYIDEVCITPAGLDCVFPNAISNGECDLWRVVSPFQERLLVSFGRALERSIDLVLYDVRGRAIVKWGIAAGATQIEQPLHGLSNGIYFLRSSETNEQSKPFRVLRISP